MNYSDILKKDVGWFSDKFKILISKYLQNLQQKYKKIVFYSLFPGWETDTSFVNVCLW
jgi:hypothetical protein